MIVAIDVGNTNVTVGLLDGMRLVRSFKVPAVAALREKLRGVSPQDVAHVYGCSVVPKANQELRRLVKRVLGQEIRLAGEDVTVPILNRYRIPHQVGQDRLVNAYAGLKLYGPGLIIVDFGTAVTFDIVSKKSEYIGGLIVPGFRLMQESLNRHTALLPYVELARPMEIIGKDTVSSIRAGLVYGMTSLIDGLIERLLKKECKGYKVVSTGGDGNLVKPYARFLKIFEESLILKGLALICLSQDTPR